jgi:hypothetical protein
MNTPKMRGLKQYFINNFFFENPSDTDGHMVEYAHQEQKDMSNEHNNSHESYKKTVTRKSAFLLSVQYAIGGGRWGHNFGYSLGSRARDARDPRNPLMPHPAIRRFVMPKKINLVPKLEITSAFDIAWFRSRDYQQVFDADSMHDLNVLLQSRTGDDSLTFANMCMSRHWNCFKVKSFKLHDGLRSFGINFANNHKCLVKLRSGMVVQFANVFGFHQNDGNYIYLAKCELWQLYSAANEKEWGCKSHLSLPYIDTAQVRISWIDLYDIVEPVLFIHNCVSFQEVKHQMPKRWKTTDKFVFNQQRLLYNHKLWCSVNRNARAVQMQKYLPCGPHYECNEHNQYNCQHCRELDKFTEQKWKTVWYCNEEYHPCKWVLDEEHGMAWALMFSTQKWKHDELYTYYDN